VAGHFITLEGLDGCGKTTQLHLIEQWLSERGDRFVSTCEPGGTSFGQNIRRVLLDSRNVGMVPLAELLLFAADRAQHVEEFIRPKLAEGVIVISDRYTDATLAFQGYGRGFDIEFCRQLNHMATGGWVPDLTLLFDIDVELALHRINERKKATSETGQAVQDESRLDNERIEFHRKVREGYLKIAAAEPKRFRIIHSGNDIETTWRETRSVMEQFFG